ncbi:MAG TPA: hypothetical protein VH080_09355 [Gemmatimonadaceae bacterium]|nr:hypothetical protein [Gemmatimonadaceae bacterium]
MADRSDELTVLDQRLRALAEVVETLIDVVVRLDDETSDTAAAAFDSKVPRVAGHTATAADLERLHETVDAWLKEWRPGPS